MLKNAKIINSQIDPEVYHKRDPEIKRGNPEYVMSKSELAEFNRNAHRWFKGYKEGDTEDTKATAWGSLIDCLVLDPERFDDKYIVAPETYPADGKKKDDPVIDKPWNWNANYCKEWREEQGDKTVLKNQELEASDLAVKALIDPIIREVLECSQKQVMAIAEWHDKATGLIIPLKSLIDFVPDLKHELYGQFLGDFKTCISAAEGAWPRTVFQHGYHIQGAFYLDIYESATEENRTDFIHILQESFDPYETGRRLLSTEFIEIGRFIYQEALKKYCQCLATNKWPGYDENTDRQVNGFTITEPEQWML